MYRTALAAFSGAALALSGCTAMGDAGMDDNPPVRSPEGECSDSAAQSMIGSTATAETGAELLRLTGAKTLRWAPPRSAMTMDFRADRLTVTYDDDMKITMISCG